jgi:putative PIN family toxin of toxin-antitoxin system
MIRAVLDSSILVSAFVAPGGAVLNVIRWEFRHRYRLCLSDYILAETGRSLLTKTRLRRYAEYDDQDVRAYLHWLLTQAEMVVDPPRLRAVSGDPKDDMIVATAVAAGADFLVTGDRRHLLPLGSYRDVRILAPREFLELLRG